MSYKKSVISLMLWMIALSTVQVHANSELWSSYLTQPEKWPQKSALAKQDILPLPAAAIVDKDLAELGRILFHTPSLSKTGDISCASCHRPSVGFSDPTRVSIGINGKKGHRNSPSLLNVDLWDVLFWDGRSTELHIQATGPLTHPSEMGATPQHAEAQVLNLPALTQAWQKAYPDKKVNWPDMALALAEFQTTLRGADTAFDVFYRYAKNQDYAKAKRALTDTQLLGMHIFRTKAGCVNCHNGELFSDQEFHNTGLHYFGRRFEDLGTYELTKIPADMGKFRTPMLRHLAQTSPWMHNGLFDDLKGIVRMYSNGGARPRRPKDLDPMLDFPITSDILEPFDMSKKEEVALLEFLKIL
jgi:cytochrome c peroxidase